MRSSCQFPECHRAAPNGRYCGHHSTERASARRKLGPHGIGRDGPRGARLAGATFAWCLCGWSSGRQKNRADAERVVLAHGPAAEAEARAWFAAAGEPLPFQRSV